MATFYTYDRDGKLLSSSTRDANATATNGHVDVSKYEERGDIVGAYLARRAFEYPAQVSSMWNRPDYLPDGGKTESRDEYADSNGTSHTPCFKSNNDSYNQANQSVSNDPKNTGSLRPTEHADRHHFYPDPEQIRHLHTLHSLLPWIHPPRRVNAISGKFLNIVEQDTGTVLAYEVSKKMLVLFLGKSTVHQFLRTTEREDNLNWKGRAVKQELSLPQGVSSKVACRVLMSWMESACRIEMLDHIWSLKVPHNMFAACTLAQTLSLFGLHRDAYRVEWTMSKNHLKRPIFAVEVETLWKTLGEHNRFTYAVIKHVGQRLRDHERDQAGSNKLWDEMYEMFGKYPKMEDRLRNHETNEQYQPSFGNEWFRNLGR